LIVRKFLPRDGDSLYEYLSLRETYRFEPGEPVSRTVASALAEKRSKGNIFYAVELKSENRLIGHLYFDRAEPEEFLTWELGYIFNPRFHGQGFCVEASGKLLEHAFAKLKAHRVNAYCNPLNTASWRVLEKLGMRREGYFRQKAFFRKDAEGLPIWHDSFAYGIVEDNWRYRGRVQG